MFNSINDFLDRVDQEEKRLQNVTVENSKSGSEDDKEFERLVHHHSNQEYLDYQFQGIRNQRGA